MKAWISIALLTAVLAGSVQAAIDTYEFDSEADRQIGRASCRERV